MSKRKVNIDLSEDLVRAIEAYSQKYFITRNAAISLLLMAGLSAVSNETFESVFKA